MTTCPQYEGCGWVCETHPDKPLEGLHACPCGAPGAPCPEAAVELGWGRYIGLEGRFVGMHSFGASGKIADVYKKFDINAGAVVRAAHETIAEVAAL